jgi:hypothetical protein
LPEPVHTRDTRIDVLRGIALLMIFINHIPGTVWEHVTSRNFGFSDAAEGFVLMSGMAAGLAYGPVFLRGTVGLAAALRPWRRALTIWWVHCLVMACVLALFALVIDQPTIEAMAGRRNIMRVFEDPAAMLLPLVLLGHQFAYADILPLYIVLMLAAPGLLFVGARWPRLAMGGALLLWGAAGVWKINAPTWPTDNSWFFNPLSWQVLFMAGILTGLAIRQGRRFLPARAWAVHLAVGFLILSALWVRVPVLAAWGGHGLWLLHEYAAVPDVFTSFNKSFLFLPRLLHILALAYALSALPWVKRVAAHPGLAPVAMLGRHSLPVFATSTVLAYAAQIIRALAPASILQDTLLIAIGICLLFMVAHLRDRRKRPVKAPVMAR